MPANPKIESEKEVRESPFSVLSDPPALVERIIELTREQHPERFDDVAREVNELARKVADALRGQIVLYSASDTCSAVCYPALGGSYACGLAKGHEGLHASLWNQPGHDHPVVWDDKVVTWK